MGSYHVVANQLPDGQAEIHFLFSSNETAKSPRAPFPEIEELSEDSAPDGGFFAWLQVFGGWLLILNTRGLINGSFGVFQTYYENEFLKGTPSSVISTIGSTQAFLLMFGGVFSGRLLDAGYLRFQLCIGISLQFFGLMMASLATKYWQMLLAQGFCVGFAAGFLYVPSIIVISQYFSTKKTLALGIAATGSCAAGIIYPILIQKLLFWNIGFTWTMRSLALIVLTLNVASLAIMRFRTEPKSTPVIFNIAAFQDLPYVTFVLAMLFLFISIYIPYFYVQDYVLDHGMGAGTAFYIIAVMNGASIFGRIMSNWMASKLGSFVMIISCCLLTCAVIFTWLTVHTKIGIILIVAAYGFTSGGLVSLPPAIINSLSKDPKEYGARVGMAFTVCSFGTLIGNPIAGALKLSGRGGKHRYLKPWLFAGGVMLTAAALMVLTAYLLSRATETEKIEQLEYCETALVYKEGPCRFVNVIGDVRLTEHNDTGNGINAWR